MKKNEIKIENKMIIKWKWTEKQRSARLVFKVLDRDRPGTVSTSETETETEEIQSQQARPRLLFKNILDWDQDQENM